MNLFKWFRIIAIVEATSYLALLVATGIKYGADAAGGVEVLGPVHGTLFLLYVVVALLLRIDTKWTVGTTLFILAGAVVPFGGYAVDAWLAKHNPQRSVTA